MATGTIPEGAVLLSTTARDPGSTFTLPDISPYKFLAFEVSHYAYGSDIQLVLAKNANYDFQLVGLANATTFQILTMSATRSGNTITMGTEKACNLTSSGVNIFETANMKIGYIYGIK